MKKLSIIIILLTFFIFLFYQTRKSSDFEVLEIISPTQIIVDINKNNICDENETITLNDIQSFSTKSTSTQFKIAKDLKISQEDAIGIGFLAENFAKETLSNKKVQLKNKNSQIIIDNKNYENLLIDKGFALKKQKNTCFITTQFKDNIKKVKKLNLVIFNNKSHKYHKLNCKYGLLAHNALIIPANQLPKDAKACKFCLNKNKIHKYDKFKNNIRFDYYDIPNVKSPKTIFESNSIKIFLTDLTKVLKPSNKCNTDVCKALLYEINSAQNSIDFAIYGYTKTPDIQSALVNAQNRGVKIRFVYDSGETNKNIYPDTMLLTKIFKDNNHDLSSKIMHNKFFIFDNKIIFTGSANISNTDLSGYNSNAVIILNSEKIANVYEQEFEQMYNGKFHKQKMKIKDKFETLDNKDFSIFFSPKDKSLKSIIPIIDNSQKYIYIPAFLVTHKELTNSLINAKNRGVSVKIILDATNTHPGSHSKMNLLRSSGIQVKTENYAGKLHSKSMVIDDLYTIIGSMNFSRSGEDENDENLIIIKDKDIALFYRTFFEYLWKRIPDKWLKYNARAESYDSIGSCSDGIDNDFDGKIDKKDDSCSLKQIKKVKH